MTDREKAIVMAYTGVVMLSGDKLGIYYQYVREKLGQCVMTHELAFPEVQDAIADAAKNDFIELAKGNDAPTVGEWISVKDRLPAETHSIFWPWYGRKEWSNAMWREQSDKVLVTVTFNDGTRLVTTGETHDGEWHTSISKTLNPLVTHWMPLPEPPKEDEDV